MKKWPSAHLTKDGFGFCSSSLCRVLLLAFLVMFPASPIYFMFRKYDYVNWNLYTGLIIAGIGIILEGVADQQLYNFIQSRQQERSVNSEQNQISNDPEANISSNPQPKSDNTYRGGLWKKSRHPNLFFELVTWIGFTIVGLNDWSKIISFFTRVHRPHLTVPDNVLPHHTSHREVNEVSSSQLGSI